ncbi:MAG: aspartate/tyrosine/aromatic aminotransferase [Clostridiales bacterium]|jgi:LL-diaminopimelate aminotransferase|nr:aspartate/tyrosine/aromatic aminotransferase [Clostridiales bacterium]
MKIVNRTSKLPPYVFSKIDEIKKKLISEGIDIIDIGIGDPDRPTPDFIVNSAIESIKNSAYHRYPPYYGLLEFKIAVAEYYKRKYNVELDHENEVAVLIGSKEGIAHLFLALADNNDYVLIPDPGYPVYNAAAVIAGCSVYKMYLKAEDQYLPRLDNIFPEVAKKAKILITNYPNNPTGAVATEEFYKNLIDFGKGNDIVIANDGAYMDICREGTESRSILQTPGAKDICVEFGTLSKAYNMTGWRIGYVVGNSEVIKKLMVIKTNFDSGQFCALQMAGVKALEEGDKTIEELNKIYELRRKIVIERLKKIGIEPYNSKGTFYVWFKVPRGYKSEEFSSLILEKTGVIITPGNTFGVSGEGYCRISLTVSLERLEEAMNRIINI